MGIEEHLAMCPITGFGLGFGGVLGAIICMKFEDEFATHNNKGMKKYAIKR